MSTNLIPIKAFLGKYYSELLYSSSQEKYKNTELDKFFEQRFLIQGNKAQMIVDPALKGLAVIITGNEIYISKEMYDHAGILVTNSLESNNQIINPKSLYNPETFSTLAYLVCQNHTIFEIVGDIDEPIYVKYKTDYETFYNSVVLFKINDTFSVEIVEEIESRSALNSVTNYILGIQSRLHLSTFYNNNISALSFVYRNIIALESASYSHITFGKGSSSVIDENKIVTYHNSKSELLACINSDGRNFHSILSVQPAAENYSINIDYRDILREGSNVTFFPIMQGQEPAKDCHINISNINLSEIPTDKAENIIKEYIQDIVDRAVLERMTGVAKFYEIKSKFLNFL